MKRRFWPEQILRSRRRKPRSNAAVGRRKNHQHTIRCCSAPSTSSPPWKFIKSGSMSPLEERIQYKFRNPLLLAEALTHPSVGHEKQQRHFDNQRLEFLGDAVLQLVVTEHRFASYSEAGEGRLSTRRSRLVSREALK